MGKPVCAVIGGSGFMGLEAVPELAQSFDVVATATRPRDGGYRTLDARDPDALAAFVADVEPDCVALLAAYRDPDFCEDHPEETRRLNTRPADLLCRILPPAARLLFVSSDYVFDGGRPPYREASDRHPVNVYGQSKK